MKAKGSDGGPQWELLTQEVLKGEKKGCKKT